MNWINRRFTATWVVVLMCVLTSSAARGAGDATPAFNIEAATRAYLDQMSPQEKARSNSYFEGNYWIQLWEFLWGVGIALVLLEGGWSAKIRDFAIRITRFKVLQTALYGVFYIILGSVLAFPLSIYTDFVREHQYGLATQGFGGWFGEQVTALALMTVFGSLAIVVLMGVVRRLRNTWHWWGAMVAIGFAVLGIVIGPVFIAPLFNKYTLLSDPKVLEPILRMARANGIETDKVYQMDASRQSTRVSANVSGLFGTMRITLNDNLLKRCTLPEIEAVMAHEMGHYVMNHIYKGVLFLTIVIVVGFGFLRFSLNWLLTRAGPRWGITGIGDVAVVPLAAVLLTTYFFLLTPIMNTFTRTQEMEADMFGLNAARQPDGAALVDLKLGEYRKMEPGPIEEWMFFDHPSGATRIRAAMRWKAENLGTNDPAR